MPRSDDTSGDSSQSVDAGLASRNTTDDVDRLFACLADQHRRLLIECVDETVGPVDLDVLVHYIATRDGGGFATPRPKDEMTEISVMLLHNHLPKMEAAGVLEVDHETNTVDKGHHFEIAHSVLAEV